MDFIYDCSLVVRLKIMQRNLRKNRLQFFKISLKSQTSVDMWFTFSEKIKVWAVDNDDIFRHSFLVRIFVSKLLFIVVDCSETMLDLTTLQLKQYLKLFLRDKRLILP